MKIFYSLLLKLNILILIVLFTILFATQLFAIEDPDALCGSSCTGATCTSFGPPAQPNNISGNYGLLLWGFTSGTTYCDFEIQYQIRTCT